MNFALISHSAILSHMYYWICWLVASPKQLQLGASRSARAYSNNLHNITASHEAVTLPMNAQTSCRTTPMRIVSFFEAGQERCATGRIRISGRMADVCAELDRLAAHEAMIKTY